MARRFDVLLAAFILLVAAAAATIWHVNADIRDQIDKLGTANSDSTQWFLAQSEVELLALQRAVGHFSAADGGQQATAGAELRKRFNVFYSRVQTLKMGQNFTELRKEQQAGQSLERVQATLDWAVPIIDGDDAVLVAAAPRLSQRLDQLGPDVRNISLHGVRLFSSDSDRRSGLVVATLKQLSQLVFVMFLILALTVLVLFFMFRSARVQTLRVTSARNRLRSLFDASIDAIVVAKGDGKIVNYNSAAERIYGYRIDEAIGADIGDLLTPDEERGTVDALLHEVRHGHAIAPEGNSELTQTTAKRKSGEIIPVELSMAVADDTDGPLLVAYVRDISRRVAEHAELVEARDSAVAGERAKAKMIAVMSHEMRTPLNGVLGTLDLLKTTALDARQKSYVAAIEYSGEMILQHVNDVLDSSRSNADHINLSQRPFDLKGLVGDVVDGMQGAAHRHGNRLSVGFQGDDMVVLGDEARIKQILVNLIGNAIKFTENGEIHVEVDRTAGAGETELRVLDTGIGIAEEDHDRIFDEFVTLGSTFDRKVEGTGLGLSIIKRLVEAMGGQIDLASELGEGSAFTVSLNLPAATAVAPQILADPVSASPADHSGMSVLVAEDNEINHLVVGQMLRSYGCTLHEARDGVEAVRRAGEERFDVILMDISMPQMNGIDATRQIRDAGPNRGTPIIALTAHAMPEDLQRFNAVGMDCTLVKPLKRVELEAILKHCATIAAVRNGDGDSDTRRELIATLGPDRAGDLIARIRSEVLQGLARLADAQSGDTTADRAALAHKLAGSAAVAGMTELRLGLTDLETGFRGAPDMSDMHILRTCALRLRDALESRTVAAELAQSDPRAAPTGKIDR